VQDVMARSCGRPAGWLGRGGFDTLTRAKRQLAVDDPERFDTYVELMEQAPEMVGRHSGELIRQLTAIVTNGSARGELVAPDPARTARAVFHAMSRFRHPLHGRYWTDPELLDHYDAVWELVQSALTTHH
jgi:hypothetical protein